MIWLKRALALAAFGIALYLFWPLLGELRNSADLFRQARWSWLAVAVVIQFASYACLTALNYFLLRPFQGHIRFWRLMAVLPAIAFIEVGLPSAGTSGAVLRARLLGRSGYSLEASAFTLVLETIYVAVVLFAVSLAGLWVLVHSGGLGPRRLNFLVGLALVVLATATWMYWAGRDRERARRWTSWLVARWNRLRLTFHQPPYLPTDLHGRIDMFYSGLAQLGREPRWPFMLAAVGRVSLDVATLGVCFGAFQYSISPGILLTGYGLTLLVSGLAALPGGLGLADVSLAVLYSRLGAPGAVAVAAALSYRLIAFWLLRIIGFVSWQMLEAQGDARRKYWSSL